MATSIVYPGQTGNQTAYPIPFEYLSRSHVKVTVGGLPVTFTFTSTFMLSVTPAPVGDLRIFRETPRDAPVNTYSDGSILLSESLNSSFIQAIFIAQEVAEMLPAKDLIGHWNMLGLRVGNITDPVNASDAVTKGYLDSTSASLRDVVESAAAAIAATNGQLIFNTKADAAGVTLPNFVQAFEVRGDQTVDDGLGGIYTTVNSGSSDVIFSGGGRVFYRAHNANRLMARPRRLKRIYIADGQPAQSGQLANFRMVLDHIKTRHSDLDRLCYAGDIVDCGDDTRPDDGSYPHVDYTFREVIKDMKSIVPRDRLDAIPGNHDINYNIDGTKAQWAFHYDDYLKWFDRQFYYTIQGNILQIHMGSMARNTAGNITDYVVDWCKELVRSHQDHFIVVVTHQPLQNTVTGSSSVGGSQLQSSRFLDWIGTAGYRVDAWFSGHSGSDLNNPAVESDKVIQGCHFFDIDMNSGVDPETGLGGATSMSYMEVVFTDKSPTVQFNRWNVNTNAISKVRTVTLPSGFAVETSGTLRHDGRTQFDGRYDVLTGPKVIAVQPARTWNGSAWNYPATVPALTLIAEDRANDDMDPPMGVSLDFLVPGGNTGSSGNNTANLNHAYGYGARIAAERLGGGERNFSAALRFYPSKAAIDSAGDEYTEAQLTMAMELTPDLMRFVSMTNGEKFRVNQDHFLMFRTSAAFASIETGLVFSGVSPDKGQIRSFKGGTSTQMHWLQYNNSLVSPTLVGGLGSATGRSIFYFTDTHWISGGSGSPEGSVTGPIGCVWMDTTNGVQYNKKTGTGNTGWKLVTQAA